jgi:hypothetical protein
MKYPAEDPRLWFEDIDAGDSRMLMLEGLFEGLARRVRSSPRSRPPLGSTISASR